MPKTRPKAKPRESALASKPTAEVLTLRKAASYLRLSETNVLRLVEEQSLPGRRVGNEWRFLLAGIRN